MNILETYNKLESEINALIGQARFNPKRNLRLERMRKLMEFLGNPEDSYKIIHVGGTAGKGSTSTMIANILQEHGLSVGLHTSPHLQVFNERHVVNGVMVPTSVLYTLWQEIAPHITWMEENYEFGAPTYFEAQVALSLLAFRHYKVEYAVVEVGLGGTLDATNVITPLVAVLTNVDLDHTEILGETVEQIAEDKAGIIKKNIDVVTSVTQDSVIEIVAQRCDAQDAQLHLLGKDFEKEKDLHLSLVGDVQINNASVALKASEIILSEGFDKNMSLQALEKTTLPARIETMQTSPLVVLDGAHNVTKIKATIESIQKNQEDKKVYALVALKQGKDAENILKLIVDISQDITVTSFYKKGLWNPFSSKELEEIVMQVSPRSAVTANDDPLDALKSVLEKAGPEDMIWIVGSLYLAGDVREYWHPKKELLESLEK